MRLLTELLSLSSAELAGSNVRLDSLLLQLLNAYRWYLQFAGLNRSAAHMFALEGSSLGAGQSVGLSETPNVWVGDSLNQRVSAVKSWYNAAQATAARLKNKPLVLSPNSVVYGFSPTGSGSPDAVVAIGSGAIGAMSAGAAGADDETPLLRGTRTMMVFPLQVPAA